MHIYLYALREIRLAIDAFEFIDEYALYRFSLHFSI